MAACANMSAATTIGCGNVRLDGKWQRLSWDTAINEIGDKVLQIREQDGPDSVYWLGSAKFSNEQAYLFRKFAALWGSNNCDHQARERKTSSMCYSDVVCAKPSRHLAWDQGVIAGEGPEEPERGEVHGEAEIRALDVNASIDIPLGDEPVLTIAGRYGYPALVVGAFVPEVSAAYWDYQLRLDARRLVDRRTMLREERSAGD